MPGEGGWAALISDLYHLLLRCERGLPQGPPFFWRQYPSGGDAGEWLSFAAGDALSVGGHGMVGAGFEAVQHALKAVMRIGEPSGGRWRATSKGRQFMRFRVMCLSGLAVGLLSSCFPAPTEFPVHKITALEMKELDKARGLIGASIKLATHDMATLCPTIESEFDCRHFFTKRITVDAAALSTYGTAYIHAYTSDIEGQLFHADNVTGYMSASAFEVLQWDSKYCGEYSPKLGMSEREVLHSSWCVPKATNTMEIRGRTTKQLVYPDLGYLYLDNGVLTGIQRKDR